MVVAHLPYRSPAVRSFLGVRNAYAQATPPLMISFNGRLGNPAVPGTTQNTGQDAFEFGVLANTALVITLTHDGNIDAEVGLFPPGVTPAGTNVLTGTGQGLVLATGGTAMFTAVAPGTWTFAIEDQRVDLVEVVGDYTVTITADKTLGPPMQVTDEGTETLRPDS